MSRVEIDDDLYISAQEYLGPIAHDGDHVGVGIAFDRWLRQRDPEISSAQADRLDSYLRALFDYSEGRYPSDQDWNEDKTIVWSYFRAWVDRFGWVVGTQ